MTNDRPVRRADVGLRSERGPILVALMTTTALIAIDATILATAVPTIVADLGGFTSFPWLFSIYLLTAAVTVPVYAKVADTIGRRPVLLLGIALFGLGSVLCGLAWSMPALIAFRALQGLGAGAVQPMAVTITGDVWSLAERAKIQGYIASVWGFSAVVGPLLGGFFAEVLTWHWIFFVNVPVCVAAAWLLLRSYHERVERRRSSVDWAGGLLLIVSVSLLMLAMLEGGNAWAWVSAPSLAAAGAGAVLLVVFVLVERRAANPILPFTLWRRPLLRTTALIAVGVGAVLLGLTAYVPTFLETTLGVTPIVSGLTLAMLSVGWPIAASQSGRLYLRFGFRVTTTTGSSLVVLGTLALALVSVRPTLAGVGAACFLIGTGMGLTATPSLIAAQSSVDWAERGVVTGANIFARSMGSAVGVAALGALVNGLMRGAAATEAPVRFHGAATWAFAAVVGMSVLVAVAAATMPARHDDVQDGGGPGHIQGGRARPA